MDFHTLCYMEYWTMKMMTFTIVRTKLVLLRSSSIDKRFNFLIHFFIRKIYFFVIVGNRNHNFKEKHWNFCTIFWIPILIAALIRNEFAKRKDISLKELFKKYIYIKNQEKTRSYSAIVHTSRIKHLFALKNYHFNAQNFSWWYIIQKILKGRQPVIKKRTNFRYTRNAVLLFEVLKL